jgi:hypothetical protein
VRKVARGFVWSEVSASIADYCRNPFTAPDRALARARMRRAELPARGGASEILRLVRRTFETLRRDGANAVLVRGRRYLRRRFK